MFKDYFLLMRPFQWVKNIIIFIPLIFSKKLFEFDSLVLSFAVFICFILASSIIYIFNDIWDLKEDKKHPLKKKTRPLANNNLKKKDAYFLVAFLGLLLSVILKFNISILGIVITFLILNIFYSIYLKNIVIIDLITMFNYLGGY
jgi:4-hydroxybenzoate polyprenyltransferase